jgi:hypothetical protein
VRGGESFDALRERQFRLLYIGQTVSLLGDGMLAFAVLGLTGSASDLGIVLTARSIPLVALLLAGGVVADRLPRRAVMVATDLVRLATQAASGALLVTGSAHVWHLAVLQAVYGSATAFYYPASTGLIPLTVSAGRLQQANALRGLSQAAGSVAGPAIAGVLVAGVGAGWALLADAASFGVSAFFLAQIRLPARERVRVQPFLRDLREGWREFTARTWVWVVVVAASAGNMLNAAYRVLGPLVAKQSLGGAGAWAAISAGFGVGSVAGGVIALRSRPRRPLLFAGLWGSFFGAPMLLLAAVAPTPAIVASAVLSGGGLMVFNTLWETTLQQAVPDRALSRVSAYDWFGSVALEPVGLAIVGPIAVALGTAPTLWGAGGLMLATTLAILAVPSVRRLEIRAA